MTVFVHEVTVEWGDCDPAGLLFYPNYYRWMDEATFHLFDSVGLGWEDLRAKYGTPGLPLVATHAEYRSPCLFRDKLALTVGVTAWGNKSLTVSHRIMNGETLAVEGWEKRIWSTAGPDGDGRLSPAPIPQEVKDIMGTMT